MSGWLLRITAVIIATTCVEMILPMGKIRSSCKTVLAIVCLAVMIEPLGSLIKTDFNSIFDDPIDYEYVETVENFYAGLYRQDVVKILEEKNIICEECNVRGALEGGAFLVEKISVKINNSVITEKDEHIIGIVEIQNYLAGRLSVAKERIEVYANIEE